MTNSYPSGSPGGPELGMPSGGPGIVPRRSSYASVVSGAASQSFSRSGALSHLLNQQSDYSYDPSYQNYGGQPRYDSRASDMELGISGSAHGRSMSWGRGGGQLPSFSSAFRSLMKGNANGPFGNNQEKFFIPSYLKGSKYVQRLESAHRAKILAHKDDPSAQPSQPGSLSTSASSASLHTKMVASHRGLAYDLIEKAPPLEDESLPPLPSKWNSQDKHTGLELLADGMEVKFTSPKPDREREHEACAIRADHPMPPQCGIYYFEVTILSRKREESSIGIGFSGKDASLSRLPGWEPESWAYHGDDGKAFCSESSGKVYGPPFTLDDTIGCGVNFRNGTAFFTKNGDHLSTAFRDVKGRLFPSIGMKKSGEHIRVNFGQSPFIFDIDGMIAREKADIRRRIEATSTAKLAPPLSETELIQSLVVQYLTHEGYVETARSFANEVQVEKQALILYPGAIIQGFDVKQDEDAGHRQRIRAAVLDGDIEKALKHTNAYYPQVLKDNEQVYFRLRCRRFIEMIRQGAEIHRSSSFNGVKRSNGHHNCDWYDDVINHDMDVDDHQQLQGTSNWDKMDTEETSDGHVEYEKLLQETLIYGQNLQAEFRDDPRREISKALNDAFALLAYQDPLGEKEVAHHLDISGRIPVAEELNSAILLSLGKSSCAALEQVIQQTTVLLEDLQEGGGPGALVNIDDYVQLKPQGLLSVTHI